MCILVDKRCLVFITIVTLYIYNLCYWQYHSLIWTADTKGPSVDSKEWTRSNWAFWLGGSMIVLFELKPSDGNRNYFQRVLPKSPIQGVGPKYKTKLKVEGQGRRSWVKGYPCRRGDILILLCHRNHSLSLWHRNFAMKKTFWDPEW